MTRGVCSSLAVVATLVLGACQGFQDLMAFQQALAQEFNESSVGVEMQTSGGEKHLTIMFTNSPKEKLPEVERAALAGRVAEFVRDRYGDYGSLTEVRVGFRRESQAGPATMKNTDAPYRFPIKR